MVKRKPWLCRLGIHRWGRWYMMGYGYNRITYGRTCKRCLAIQCMHIRGLQ